jgi:ATP-dependent helicase HrpA
LALRQERALQDPAKDQARMLSVKAFNDASAALMDAGRDTESDVARFRQDVEELNVLVFAQELALKGAVSEKRLAKQLAALI